MTPYIVIGLIIGLCIGWLIGQKMQEKASNETIDRLKETLRAWEQHSILHEYELRQMAADMEKQQQNEKGAQVLHELVKDVDQTVAEMNVTANHEQDKRVGGSHQP